MALALEGCSVVDLHADTKSGFSERVAVLADEHSRKEQQEEDDEGEEYSDESDSANMVIRDVFAVVDRTTGKQFEDDQLERLAHALLTALETPIHTLSSVKKTVDKKTSGTAKSTKSSQAAEEATEQQVTIIYKTGSKTQGDP